MKYEKCLICGEYGWDNHVCDPKFYVFREDEIWSHVKYGFGSTYRGKDSERAAIRYCDGDYELPNELDLWVISEKDLENILSEEYDHDDNDVIDEIANQIEVACDHYYMDSEVVRNFYASKIK